MKYVGSFYKTASDTYIRIEESWAYGDKFLVKNLHDMTNQIVKDEDLQEIPLDLDILVALGFTPGTGVKSYVKNQEISEVAYQDGFWEIRRIPDVKFSGTIESLGKLQGILEVMDIKFNYSTLINYLTSLC